MRLSKSFMLRNQTEDNDINSRGSLRLRLRRAFFVPMKLCPSCVRGFFVSKNLLLFWECPQRIAVAGSVIQGFAPCPLVSSRIFWYYHHCNASISALFDTLSKGDYPWLKASTKSFTLTQNNIKLLISNALIPLRPCICQLVSSSSIMTRRFQLSSATTKT